MRNLHLRAQTFSQACHASGTGQINGAWPSLTAFRQPTRVEILYQSARDAEPRWRRIEPYAVLLGLRYYLIGRDADADEATKYRQYRFDRILQINLTVETFERDPSFDVEEYSTLAFGAFFSEEEYGPVRWQFAPSAAPAAREFVFHPKQEMTELEDGSLLVEFAASGWVEMAWHLVKWGPAFEVLAPLQLKDMLDLVRQGQVEVLP
jgi:predicted DNA-binding transcriptional regulator YafY